MDHYTKTTDVAGDLPRSEAWLFTQTILGRPIPQVVRPEVKARSHRAELERRAQFSAQDAQELRKLQAAEHEARCDRDVLEWAAQISTEVQDMLRPIQQVEAQERRAWDSIERFTEGELLVEEWNEADHPRAPKGTPIGGQWVPKGGAGLGVGRSRSAPINEPERVLNNIRRRSGNKWSGDRVLDVMSALAPGWLPFVKKHATLSLTSGGATKPATTVRRGEFGAPISDLSVTPLRTQGPLTIHFEIPAGWNDIQVAEYMLSQFADELDVHWLAAGWATNKPELFKEIQDERFKNGLSTVATLAGGYYTAIASLAPGGQLAVATWDIQNGDALAAALDVAFLLPVGRLAKSGIEASGAIAIKAGDRLVGVLPAAAIEKIGRLAPEQATLLHKRLLAAKTEQEAAEIVAKFLGTQFDRHHPLPKFLGGETKQLLAKIPKSIHQEFHSLLRQELRAAGFGLPIGTKTGSRDVWLQEFAKSAGAQGRAFDAVLKASRSIDEKHGTELTQWVWKNLVGENYFYVPGGLPK